MKIILLIIPVSLILCGCSPNPEAKIQCIENGEIMSNEYSFRAEKEVIRSYMVLQKVVDALDLSKAWGVSKKDAANRLYESLMITPNRSEGTISIRLKGLNTENKVQIINTICEQIPKDQQSITDPTPVTLPASDTFDPNKYPDGFPLSENAQTNHTKVVVIQKAQ